MTSENYPKKTKNTIGSSGGDLVTDKDKEFFSNREIWEQVFGKDGRGGAIGNLHDIVGRVDRQVNEKFKELEDMICSEFKKSGDQMSQIQSHLKVHNGVKEKVTSIDETLSSHLEEWEDFAETVRTEEKVQVRLDAEHEKGVDEGDRIFNKRAKLVSIYIAIVGIIIGALVKILFY